MSGDSGNVWRRQVSGVVDVAAALVNGPPLLVRICVLPFELLSCSGTLLAEAGHCVKIYAESSLIFYHTT